MLHCANIHERSEIKKKRETRIINHFVNTNVDGKGRQPRKLESSLIDYHEAYSVTTMLSILHNSSASQSPLTQILLSLHTAI